jgi:hypothetical protein
MNWIFLQTLRGSFSAVSTPILASKYSLVSSWRDLQDLHLYILLHRSDLKISAKIVNVFSRMKKWISEFFHFLCRILHFFCELLMNFCPDFATNSRKEWRRSLFNQFCENKLENSKLPKILKYVENIYYFSLSFMIIHYFSLFFIVVHYYSFES